MTDRTPLLPIRDGQILTGPLFSEPVRGRQLAAWLREQGHDVFDAWEIGTDPRDPALLERARMEGRVMATLDQVITW